MNGFCQSGLYIACVIAHVDMARVLLDNGADVNVETTDGKTPLIVARKLGEILRVLRHRRGA